MIIDRITMTGADDSILPEQLIYLSQKYPLVEWGILLSSKQQGNQRYPSLRWIHELKPIAQEHNFQLAGHLCGRWVKSFIQDGNNNFWMEQPELWDMFQRYQLNFHAEPHQDCQAFIDLLKGYTGKQFIFQQDGVNNGLAVSALDQGVDAVPLFDKSGGAGVVPTEWPKPWHTYCGYAGGLGPHNLDEELDRIEAVVGGSTIWVDMETWIRTGAKFDLEKVDHCLEIITRRGT